MNFEQLREIIKNIKTNLTCSSCGAGFINEDIHILSSTGDKCILMVHCQECKNPMLVTASINSKNSKLTSNPYHNITELNEDGEIVSSDDVLEVHDFLKDFDGDFAKILPEKFKNEK